MNNSDKLVTQAIWNNRYSMRFAVDEAFNIDSLLTNELATTTKGTWGAWVRPVDATPVSVERFISFGDTNADAYFSLYMNTVGVLRYFTRNAGGPKCDKRTNASAFSDNVYTHIGLTVNGVDIVTLYVNGMAPAQTYFNETDKGWYFANDAGLDNGRLACLNKGGGGNTGFFNGNVDEVSFWDDDFSADEMSELYNSGVPFDPKTHSKQANLVGGYRMGENGLYAANWTLPDEVNSNDATSINMELDDRQEIAA